MPRVGGVLDQPRTAGLDQADDLVRVVQFRALDLVPLEIVGVAGPGGDLLRDARLARQHVLAAVSEHLGEVEIVDGAGFAAPQPQPDQCTASTTISSSNQRS